MEKLNTTSCFLNSGNSILGVRI